MDPGRVFNAVLRDVMPSASEERRLRRVQGKLTSAVSLGKAEPMFCGSVAKGTWLAGHKDIDLFLLFDPAEDRSVLENEGVEEGKRIIEACGGKWQIAYSEHPYIKGVIDGHQVDIVPAYNVPDPSSIKSAVDRTPYHVRYVLGNASQDIKSDIRLLKKFCSAAGVYGSDLVTEGLSGYLCELLVIHYGSMESVLRAAASWEPGEILDLEGHHSNKHHLREKFGSPLIVVDPVDGNRNVASVLSPEKFLRFQRAASDFLAKPDVSFFYSRERKPLTRNEMERMIESRGTSFIIIRFHSPKVHEDTLWTQLGKFSSRAKSILEENEFQILRTGKWFDSTHSVIVLELLVDELPKIQKRRGPSFMDSENSKRFMERYRGHHMFLEDGVWVVEHFRAFTRASDLLAARLGTSSEMLRSDGVPSYVADAIEGSVEMMTDEHIFDAMESDDMKLYMTDYLTRMV